MHPLISFPRFARGFSRRPILRCIAIRRLQLFPAEAVGHQYETIFSAEETHVGDRHQGILKISAEDREVVGIDGTQLQTLAHGSGP